ncbi:MAG: SHOCT domain-containing protein [Lawsonibacter sp.]|nr:SHOCT domain-containing protein [Lawsonibacter sp.]
MAEMRTALEMADFILSKQPGLDIYFNAEKAREKRRRHYADLFRPIERALGPNFGLAAGGDDDVLYAVTSYDVHYAEGIFSDPESVAAAFTANRCIIAYQIKGEETVETIPYDEISGIEARQAPEKFWDNFSEGHLILSAPTVVWQFHTRRYKNTYYEHFDPDQACEAVTELVMKYKQAKYAAQQGTAAPQYSQQTPPPKAPQGEAPQERSQWSAAQLDTAQRTAARLTAALQAPQPPEAAAPAASPAGAGLSAETVEALKQLKGLLDAGILTQEEFDAKKKQLLGL